jgi:hypothetical protein
MLAANEAISLGRGGVTAVAAGTGIARSTTGAPVVQERRHPLKPTAKAVDINHKPQDIATDQTDLL